MEKTYHGYTTDELSHKFYSGLSEKERRKFTFDELMEILPKVPQVFLMFLIYHRDKLRNVGVILKIRDAMIKYEKREDAIKICDEIITNISQP